MMKRSLPSSLISWPEYLPNRIWSPALTSSGTRVPSLSHAAAADGDDRAALRLLLGAVGDDDAADLLLAFVEAVDDDPVVQGSNIHEVLQVLLTGAGG